MEPKMPITVLVVEDDPGVRVAIVESLKDWGFAVLEAPNGFEALEILKMQDADIIITDIQMPILGGVEVLRFAKEQGKKTEVVMITGYQDAETALAAVQYGAYDYLCKPFSLPKLRCILEHIALDRSRERQGEQ